MTQTTKNSIYCKRLEHELMLHSFGEKLYGSYCCVAHEVDMAIPGALEQVKIDLANGKWPKHCHNCEREEKKGLSSWRTVGNDTDLSNLKVVEIYLDNTCDLACIYCSSKYSSKWASELQSVEGQAIRESINDADWNAGPTLDYTAEIYEQIAELGRNSAGMKSSIRLLGGEPLLSKHVKNNIVEDVVNTFYASADADAFLMITINTNGNTPDAVLDKTIERIVALRNKYKRLVFNVTMSIDSPGNNAEFIRYGVDYNHFLNNFRKYLRHGIITGLRITMNAVSIKHTAELLHTIYRIANEENQPTYALFGFIKYPEYLSLGMLPEENKEIINQIQNIVNAYVPQNENDAIRIMREKTFDTELHLKAASDHIGTSLRNPSIAKTYAERGLKFFDYCKSVRKQDILDIDPELYSHYKKLAGLE